MILLDITKSPLVRIEQTQRNGIGTKLWDDQMGEQGTAYISEIFECRKPYGLS